MADGLLGFQDPTNIGLLTAGLGILSQANGPNSRGAIGQGALLGLNAFQNAREGQAVEAYRTAQAQRLQQQGAMDAAKAAILQRFAGGGQPASAPGAVQGGGLLGMSAPQGQPGGLLAGAMPAASPSAMPQAGGAQGFPLSLNDVMQLKLAGIDVFDQYKYANDGIKQEAGATYKDPVTGSLRYIPKVGEGQELVYGPNGPSVRALQGYNAAQAQAAGMTAGATAAAQLPYQIAQDRDQQTTRANLDLIPVPDGRGGSVMMTRADAAARLPSGQPSGAVQPGRGGGRFGMTQSPADQAYDSELAKAASGTYSSLQDAGRAADKQISSYREIDRLLGDYEGGKLSGLGMSAAKLANSLDIKLDPKLADKEAAVAIGNELALQMRDPSSGMGMPGAMSDADREFLLQSVPNIGQSAGGRRQLIDYKVKMLERNKVVADSARKWQQKYGRIDAIDEQGNDFQTALKGWANENPMFHKQSGSYSNLWGG